MNWFISKDINPVLVLFANSDWIIIEKNLHIYIRTCFFQSNALKVITPATLDILLKMLSSNELSGPANELRQDLLELKDLALKSIICMVHMIHGSSPDQVSVDHSESIWFEESGDVAQQVNIYKSQL